MLFLGPGGGSGMRTGSSGCISHEHEPRPESTMAAASKVIVCFFIISLKKLEPHYA